MTELGTSDRSCHLPHLCKPSVKALCPLLSTRRSKAQHLHKLNSLAPCVFYSTTKHDSTAKQKNPFS